MNLYRKLFGRLQAPMDDGADLAGADRGDELLPEPVVEDEAPEVEAKEPEAKEPEAEVEEDDEEEAEAKPEEPVVKHKQTAKERVREVIEKSKAREAEYKAKIQELEAAQSRGKLAEDFSAAEQRLGEMEEKYAQLLMDGEAKEATKLRGEMRQLERAMTNEQSRQEALAAKESVKEELKYDTAISTLEATYPQIDPDSNDYDKEAVAEILDLHKGLMSQGLPPSMAIARAVKYVLGNATKPDTTPSVVDKGLQRTKEAKVRNAAVAGKQPVSTSKAGVDSDRFGPTDASSVMQMSYKDFSALSDEALSKMRGDTL